MHSYFLVGEHLSRSKHSVHRLPVYCAESLGLFDTKDSLTITAWAIQVACAPEYRGLPMGTCWGLLSCLTAIVGATQWSLEMLLCETEKDAPGPFWGQLLDPTTAVQYRHDLPYSLWSLLRRQLVAPYILDYMLIIDTSN